MRLKIISQSREDTLRLGKRIAKKLKGGDIICLFGQLGSGKTVLTKGIASGLGINQRKIISPTFVLIRQYLAKENIPFYHLDLYRMEDPRQIINLGYEEYFYSDGISVIEWADRLKYLLPENYLKIELGFKSDTQRSISLEARGKHFQKLLGELDEDIQH